MICSKKVLSNHIVTPKHWRVSMNKNLFVVLMAGGVGTRFWPYSRNAHPKQFLDVLGLEKHCCRPATSDLSHFVRKRIFLLLPVKNMRRLRMSSCLK
ncbi:MAG: sugar phosphate nucleotidyltransferase [Cytophagales bacterium]|nr:sugar phosphate nucleotidyltransferase [Cytophagales bacterium]